MNYRIVIRNAWELTQTQKRLIMWYGFIPSLLTTLVGILYVSYQIVATYKTPYFSGKEQKSFLREVIEMIITFVKTHHDLGLFLIIVSAVILVLYLLLPTLCRGALIQLTTRIQNNQKIRIRDGLTYGLFSFLPLLEYHLLIKSFSVGAILVEAAFIFRNLGIGWFQTLFFPFLLFAFIGLILSLLFTYADYFIVIDKQPVFSSIIQSSKLVLLQWQATFLIVILMTLITIRIIFNILLVLVIPAIILIPAGYIATKTLAIIGFIFGLVIGVVALFFAAYFGAILEVFTTAVWVNTFLALTTKGEVSAREIGVTVSALDHGNSA
ncbi:hypothetical protein HYV57_00230 [Candidatus Peregrinibacteria bacterium]|nr:hypothetical protein [Candidatus Peregrinibacteria bacterium]